MKDPERYAVAKRVFLEASRLPAGERTRFIDRECDGDDDLRASVRRLLTLDNSTDFLDATALPADAPRPGTVLGRYRIVRVLGEGGMGVVYEAQQDEPARRVALKVIHPGVFSDRLRARFRHEIRALGHLRHPGIASIYDAGTLDLAGSQVPFFAMELIEGRGLIETARGRRLGVREKLALIAQVCDAVHHAHQKGVIHRDLKPANILVEEADSSDSGTGRTSPLLQVKILDFGVSRVTEPDLRAVTIRTDVGQLVGTVPYMSPEQAAGDPDAIDTRTDVYAIGVLAYELLAGRLPYAIEGCTLADALHAIRETEPVTLGSVDRTLRGDVSTIVAKALEKERDRRYGSAAEMAADIRRFLRDEPIAARPASALYQLRKFARRHRPLVTAAALIFVAMGAATVISTWQAGVANRARAHSVREADRAKLAAAAAALGSGDPITARHLLDEVRPESRSWTWHHWFARLDESVAAADPGGPVAGAWLHEDGPAFTIVMRDGAVRRWNPLTGTFEDLVRVGRPPVEQAVATADGTRLVALHGGEPLSLDVFDLADGRLLRHVADPTFRGSYLLSASADAEVIVAAREAIGDHRIWRAGNPDSEVSVAHSDPLRSVAASADGSVFALASNMLLGAWDTRTLAPRLQAPLGWELAKVALNRDGSVAVTGGDTRLLRVWDTVAGSERLTLRGHSGQITAVALDGPGTLAASAAMDRTLRLWDVRTGRQNAILFCPSGTTRRLRITPDGSRLLTVGSSGMTRLWQANPYEDVSILRGHESYIYAVAFTPDGSRLLSAAWDGTVRVWDPFTGLCVRVIPTNTAFVRALAVSPDGAMLATGSAGPTSVHLWDLATGARIRRAPLFDQLRGGITGLAFSPDGTRLLVTSVGAGLAVHSLDSDTPVPLNLEHHTERAIAFSSDHRLVASGIGDGPIIIRDAATLAPLRRLEGHTDHVNAVAFSSSGLLASGSRDSTVRLWDPRTGACLAVLERHWDEVFAVAFSPDGRTLASGSDDTTIRIWDVDARAELAQLHGHHAYVHALAFSPDGRMLVSGSGDTTVRIWDTRPVAERWRARLSAQGSLDAPPSGP